jgi:hypothetical protein
MLHVTRVPSALLTQKGWTRSSCVRRGQPASCVCWCVAKVGEAKAAGFSVGPELSGEARKNGTGKNVHESYFGDTTAGTV